MPAPPASDSITGPGPAAWRAAWRDALRLTLIVYAATLTIFLASSALLGDLTWTLFVEFAIPMMVVDAMVALTIFPVVWVSEGWPPTSRWLAIAATALTVAMVQTAWDTFLRDLSGSTSPGWTLYEALVRAAVLNTYHSGLFAALLVQQAAARRIRAREREAADAHVAEQLAQLAALRYQLNPHFLFNAMNALSSLVVLGRNAEAEAMIDKLTEFLRGPLFADPGSMVRLEDEFAMLEAYLAIERTRFGDRLLADLSLPTELGGAIVPALLLQPLVENAMKYAVAPARRPVTVRIAAAREGDELVLTVADDGDTPPTTGGTGIGLENVRRRLAIAHGKRGRLGLELGETGFCATVWLPLTL